MFNKVHLIGINGRGMSCLAELLTYINPCLSITGSDIKGSSIVPFLESLGIQITIPHCADSVNIDFDTAVVYSSAVSKDNEEYQKALSCKAPIYPRIPFLHSLLHNQPIISITGTHGKTTTSSIIGWVFDQSNMPFIHCNGGSIFSKKTSLIYKKDYCFSVVELDESDGFFVDFKSEYSVITSTDLDHVDHYTSPEMIQNAYKKFIVSNKSVCIACFEDNFLRENFYGQDNVMWYGFSSDCDVYARNIIPKKNGSSFDVVISLHEKRVKVPVFLPLVGEYNILNALPAFILGYIFSVSFSSLSSYISSFPGVKGRMNIHHIHGHVVIHDYAHHPYAITKSLEAIRENFKYRLVCIVEGHRLSRLKYFFDGFIQSLAIADIVCIYPLFEGNRDTDEISLLEKMSQQLLIKGVSSHFFDSDISLMQFLYRERQTRSVFVFLGPGNIVNLFQAFIQS